MKGRIIISVILIFSMLALIGYMQASIESRKKFKNQEDKINFCQQRLIEYILANNQLKEEIEKYKFYQMNWEINQFIFQEVLQSVYFYSKIHQIDPFLIMSIIHRESNFNPYAISDIGCKGLMQINVPVWRSKLRIDDSQIFQVGYNINLGIQILKFYLNETNDIDAALRLYYGGYEYLDSEDIYYPKSIRKSKYFK